MYKAVVFDLDGTLVDSRLCFDTIRERLGIPQGLWILEHLATLPQPVRGEKLALLEQIEMEAARSSALFDGVEWALRRLRDQGVKLGVFTRNCSGVTHYIVEYFELEFDVLITRDDAPAKPDPTGLHRCLDLWRLQGQDLLYVGDVRSDIECGRLAGVRTALFTNGESDDRGWSPDHVVRDYSDLLNCVLKIGEPRG